MVQSQDLVKYFKVLDGGGLLICVFLILLKKVNTFLQYRSVKKKQSKVLWTAVFYHFLRGMLVLNINLVTTVFLQFLNNVKSFIQGDVFANNFEQKLLQFFTTVELHRTDCVIGLKKLEPFYLTFSGLYNRAGELSSEVSGKKTKIIKKFAYAQAFCVPVVNVDFGCEKLESTNHLINYFSTVYFKQNSVKLYGTSYLVSGFLFHSLSKDCGVLRYSLRSSFSQIKVLQGMFRRTGLKKTFNSWTLKHVFSGPFFKASRPVFLKLRRRKIKKFKRFLRLFSRLIGFYSTTLLLTHPKLRFSLGLWDNKNTANSAKKWTSRLKQKYLKTTTTNSAGRVARVKRGCEFTYKIKPQFSTFRFFSTQASLGSKYIIEFNNDMGLGGSSSSALDEQNQLTKVTILKTIPFVKSISTADARDSITGKIPVVSRQYFFKRCALGYEWRKPFGLSYFKTMPFETVRMTAPGFSRTLLGAVNTTRALDLARVLFSDKSSYLNIPVSSFIGGSLDDFVNSFFRRKSVKWVNLNRRRVSFRRLRLFFFNPRRLLATRNKGNNVFRFKTSQYNNSQNRAGGSRTGVPLVATVKRYFKKRVNYRTLSSMFFRELMFSRRKSTLRTTYLRKCLHFVRAVKETDKATMTKDQKVPAWFFWLKRRRIHFYWKIFRKRKPQKSRENRLRVRRQLRNFKWMWRNWNLTRLRMSYVSLFFNPGHKSTITGYWYRRTLRRRQARKFFGKRVRSLYGRMTRRLIATRWLSTYGFRWLADSEEDRLSLYQDFYLPWVGTKYKHSDLFFARGLLRFKVGKPKRPRTIESFNSVSAYVHATDIIKIKNFKN